MTISKNREFMFIFEGIMTNPNGDPDQENKPRMDYETSTLLVSDARRKRDVRDFLKNKDYRIFVDTLAEKKVPMDVMFNEVLMEFLSDKGKVEKLLENEKVKANWILGEEPGKYAEEYEKMKADKKKKEELGKFNNTVYTEIIKNGLVDIRLFGSAMAVENHSKTYTGPVQITWGYSLHPCQLVKSSTITSIMNDDNSTFGKKYQVEYALVAHHGTVNKFAAKHTGMTEEDMELFRKSLVQGMMNNQTASKQGQSPLGYIELEYSEDFDGYLGDMRRFVKASYDSQRPVKSIDDITIDFSGLKDVIEELKGRGYIYKVTGWMHPGADMNKIIGLPEFEEADLLGAVTKIKK